ncbi:hypothetical protein BcellWH2_05545 [Bacteroides cellulosilyticus]|uniref:Uncharacterized protein n=1 Tax=Bacteroides cellulosilyticus TaxID=246787 RepID=A0A0P0G6R4_9BACE|nr:hypothetical protein BcellWH2_05545 [Bacteroides cellulosilyticus]
MQNGHTNIRAPSPPMLPLEKYAPKTSPDQDLCRRCKKFIKKLNNKKK